MKEYMIWLKSGQCIEGEIEEDKAEKLLNTFKTFPESNSPYIFTDSNGTVYLRLSEINGIAINDMPQINKSVGFTAS